MTGGWDASGDDFVSAAPSDFGVPNHEPCIERGNQDEFEAAAICLPF